MTLRLYIKYIFVFNICIASYISGQNYRNLIVIFICEKYIWFGKLKFIPV